MSKHKESKINKIIHSWAFWLILITGIAIIIRSIPAWLNAAWGLDFGIYYGLTNQFVETKEFINPYTGWGSSYQYFPVLYTMTGVLHLITGIEVIEILPKIAPIFGGLVVTVFYFIVKELLNDKKIALLSSALLAVSVFHVYQTSHAAPLTAGHFFMMISLYFFIRFEKHPAFSIPLILSTALLIFSHHFTTYFYILSITFLTFAYISRLKKLNKQSLQILAYVIFASASAFSYWAFIAKPVYDWFMSGNFLLPSFVIISLYYVFLAVGIYAALHWDLARSIIKRFTKPLNMQRNKKIVLAFIVALSLLVIASILGIPGIQVKITTLAIIYSLPMLVVLSLSYAGLTRLSTIKNGYLIKGWFVGLFLSLLYSLVAGKLLPDRHFEYLIVPLCIPAAITLTEILAEHPIKMHYSVHKLENVFLRIIANNKKSIMVLGFVALLFIANLMITYPAIESLNTIDERVSYNNINTFGWMDGNISNTSVIASDHRLEMLLWALGFETTYGETNVTWIAENFSDCMCEIRDLNISYILIDDIMRENVVNVDVGKYYHMTNESYDKFKYQPFELVYRNATLNQELEETHWVEIYSVDKSYLFDIEEMLL